MRQYHHANEPQPVCNQQVCLTRRVLLWWTRDVFLAAPAWRVPIIKGISITGLSRLQIKTSFCCIFCSMGFVRVLVFLWSLATLCDITKGQFENFQWQRYLNLWRLKGGRKLEQENNQKISKYNQVWTNTNLLLAVFFKLSHCHLFMSLREVYRKYLRDPLCLAGLRVKVVIIHLDHNSQPDQRFQFQTKGNSLEFMS